jgi:type IV secretory pathway TrbL component
MFDDYALFSSLIKKTCLLSHAFQIIRYLLVALKIIFLSVPCPLFYLDALCMLLFVCLEISSLSCWTHFKTRYLIVRII